MRWSPTFLVGLLLSLGALGQSQEEAAPRRRVVVFEFQNLRKDKDTDWIGAATAETLTSKLASVKALLVQRPKVMGIGNGYLQDILFRARLHPRPASAGSQTSGRRRSGASTRA